MSAPKAPGLTGQEKAMVKRQRTELDATVAANEARLTAMKRGTLGTASLLAGDVDPGTLVKPDGPTITAGYERQEGPGTRKIPKPGRGWLGKLVTFGTPKATHKTLIKAHDVGASASPLPVIKASKAKKGNK